MTNKYLLRQPATTKPVVFTFWVGLMSIFTFVLAPFGLRWPGWGLFVYDIFVGIIFFFALLMFYWSLDINEASRSASLIGGLIPVLVLVLSFSFLGDRLSWAQLLAFFLLVSGGFLISLKRDKSGLHEALKGLKFVVLAILIGAIYWVLAKYAFNQQGFITGFVWTRLGLVVAAVLILIYSPWRRMILNSGRQATAGLSELMISSKVVAGFGSLFVHLALSRASASLVNALQGTEYVFLLILTFFVSKEFPGILREKSSAAVIAQKIVAILLIGGGLAILAI